MTKEEFLEQYLTYLATNSMPALYAFRALSTEEKEEDSCGITTLCDNIDDFIDGGQGGDTMPPALKYGQGSIRKRERIKQDKTKYTYWEAQYKGKAFTAKTQKDCLKKLNDYKKTEKTSETTVYTPTPEDIKTYALPERETFGTFIERYYTVYREPNIRKSTGRTYRYTVDSLKDKLGHYYPDELTLDIVQNYLNSIPGSNIRQKAKVFLKAALNLAQATDVVTRNVAMAAVVKHRAKKRRPYHFDEQVKMLATLEPEFAAIFFFLCCTGLRISEYLALNHEDIFAKDCIIRVRKALCVVYDELDETKTETSERDIDYAKELLSFIGRYHNLATLIHKYTYHQIYGAIKKAAKSAEIKGVCVHSTRHTFASMSKYCTIPDTITQERLGHATLTMTLDTYTHNLRGEGSPILDYFRILAKKTKRR